MRAHIIIGDNRWSAAFLTCALGLLVGCAAERYKAAPLDAAATAKTFEARTPDDPGLRDYMAEHGRSIAAWPLERWDLADLTLAAFYFHPELSVARAQADAARAQADLAAQRLPIGLAPQASHHSRVPADASTAWSLGFELELPLAGPGRRDAVRERYDALAEAALLKIGDAAWAVRSGVRASLLAVHANHARSALLEEQARARREMSDLLERRVAAGVASAPALNAARLELARVEGDLHAARATEERSLADLAQAVALPLARVQKIALDFSVFEAPLPTPSSAEVQRDALLNRIDVRAKLLEYAAADAALKLEIARQTPALALKPAFLWDQGDNIWSLAAALLLPAAGNRPAIEAATAERALAAEEFKRLQIRAVTAADGARARYLAAVAAAASIDLMLAASRQNATHVEKQFGAGYADRLERVAAQLEHLSVQQNALTLRVEAQQALGMLEDGLQVPLAGGPLPPRPDAAPSGAPSDLPRQ